MGRPVTCKSVCCKAFFERCPKQVCHCKKVKGKQVCSFSDFSLRGLEKGKRKEKKRGVSKT